MLSDDIQRRLVEARLNEGDYRPLDAISKQLSDKDLIMIVGPTATGKTYVMKKLAELDPRFGRVSVFTTREPRPDDDAGMFRYLPHTNESVTALLDQIARREIVQYAVHPTQSRIYGTDLSDYQSSYNLLATFSGAVEQFQGLPFRSTHIVSLMPPAKVWAEWFNARYAEKGLDRKKRLEEALISLDWLLDPEQQSLVLFVENVDRNPALSARKVAEAIVTSSSDERALDHAYEMREWAKSALKMAS